MDSRVDQMKMDITQDIEWVAKEFEEFHRLKGKRGKIISTSWSNQERFMAYVSYFPHADPSEESIDAAIELSMQKEIVSLNADISRSNGVILKDITSQQVDIRSDKEVVEKVRQFSQKARIELLAELKKMVDIELYLE